MFKYLAGLMALLSSATISAQCIDSVNSFEFGLGWRRDSIDWKLKDVSSSYFDADANSHIRFSELNYYMVQFKGRSVGESYYLRYSADYGLSDKGKAKEHFGFYAPDFNIYDLEVRTDDRVKRKSEVYDYDVALGYPFTLCHCKLVITPLIGFSYHRIHLRSKIHHTSSSSSSSSSSDYYYGNDYNDSSSHSGSFYPDSSNPFDFPSSYDPFQHSSSDPMIASALGLSTEKRTSMYRFTYYGPYVGVDIGYAIDSYWTIFGETECHFLDNCHRKRHSVTGISFVDNYHHKGWAYGFSGTYGANWDMGSNYYASLSADFKWWKAHSGHHDELHWQSVGVNLTLGYAY